MDLASLAVGFVLGACIVCTLALFAVIGLASKAADQQRAAREIVDGLMRDARSGAGGVRH